MTNYKKAVLIERIENGFITTSCNKEAHFNYRRYFDDIDELLDYIKVQMKIKRY